ncbi:vitamin K epoxide reductase family protein [Aggregatilinea lenta]|uniref:vitamin K epoxide reductase family protein n=1 Tax=Aggregatilinea lenta TaxID=913108 RepID=UPI0013C3666F|nr:vitamin K epoxide reductase family protein [Aggregatilinea lenta]
MTATKAKNTEAVKAASGLDWLRIVSILLAIAGIAVAGYLSWAEVTGNETQCLDTGKINCETVQSSAYSEVLGVPIALLGLAGYIAILGVLLLEDQVPFLAAYGRTLIAGFALFGVLFSVYLTLIEATVLDAWCQWCVISALLITLLLIVGAVRLNQLFSVLRS